MLPSRKSFLSVVLAAIALWAGNGAASQFGLMLGGGVEVRESADTMSIIPYYNSNDIGGSSKLRYHVPVAFTFDQEDAVEFFGLSVIPSLEYDLFAENKFGVSTTLGLALTYNTFEGTGDNLDQFTVGVVPSLHVKYAFTDKFLLRFIPASLNVSPWSYTSDDVGSETGASIAYQIQGGFGYNF